MKRRQPRTDGQVAAILRDYANHLNIPLITGHGEGPVWTGEALRQDLMCNAGDWAHELGHWITDPEHRHLESYGWGGDYQWGNCDIGRKDHTAEMYACVLGFALIAYSGGNPHELYESYGFYWDGQIDPDFYFSGWRPAVQPYVNDFKVWWSNHRAGYPLSGCFNPNSFHGKHSC